jgi:hypothetical protein
MGPPICNPSGICKTWQVFRGGRLEPVITQRDQSGTGSAADFMIMKTSFLVKIIHRTGARSIHGEKLSPNLRPDIGHGLSARIVSDRAGRSDTSHRRVRPLGPHETYIPFGNYRYSLLARAARHANSQVNTDKNRCPR